MKKLLSAAAVVGAAVVVGGLGGRAEVAADHVTGCLTPGGAVISLAIGGRPARPCARLQMQITLELQDPNKPEIIPFFIALDGDGARKTIATNGPLEVFARCEVNAPDPFDPGAALSDAVSIVATSTANGWVAGSGGVRSAGEEVTLLSGRRPARTEFYGGATATSSGGSTLAPDGSYIGIIATTTGLGANIFGHDCIAVGTATLIKGGA